MMAGCVSEATRLPCDILVAQGGSGSSRSTIAVRHGRCGVSVGGASERLSAKLQVVQLNPDDKTKASPTYSNAKSPPASVSVTPFPAKCPPIRVCACCIGGSWETGRGLRGWCDGGCEGLRCLFVSELATEDGKILCEIGLRGLDELLLRGESSLEHPVHVRDESLCV